MSTSDLNRAGAVAWGELMHSDVMRDAWVPVASSQEQLVHHVKLVSDVEQVRSCRPGTLVVLQESIARAPWVVEVAIRYGWERNVCCVVAQIDGSAAAPVVRLAERLSVAVALYDGDMPALALQLSALVSHPEAVRARVVEGCVDRLTDEVSVAGILEVLNHDVPGTAVALLGPNGGILAGTELSSGQHVDRVSVPLEPPDFQTGRELVASVSDSSSAWTETIGIILRVARAQIVAYEAADRLKSAARSQRERWVLSGLTADRCDAARDPLLAASYAQERVGMRAPHKAAALAEGSGPLDGRALADAANGLGWITEGVHVGIVLLPSNVHQKQSEGLGLALRAAWTSPGAKTAPVPYLDGWALWETFSPPGDSDDPPDPEARPHSTLIAEVADHVHRQLDNLELGVAFCAGVGEPAENIGGLAKTLGQAMLAARAARSPQVPRVALYGTLGPHAAIATVDNPHMRSIAEEMLAPLFEEDDTYALLTTLSAYLDSGGSSSRAAERLSIHRNTVMGRMSRIRRTGIRPEDPDGRLALHMACHVLLAPGGESAQPAISW